MDNLDLLSYDKYIVNFSGGKDSTCCFLYLLENGVPIEKIELWHQLIDGYGKQFFDWEVTSDYCRKFAEAFGVPIYYQWKKGGFKREMLRKDSYTAPTYFEAPDGFVYYTGGESGSLSTRWKFPQQSADLNVRWCSAYLKINVCTCALRNQERFNGIKTLVISGERGEESPQRAKYKIFEPDKADLRDGINYQRHIDRFRPIRDWKEAQVWELIEKYRIRVHPCYYMGWSRCSCKFCIFGGKNQFASVNHISPYQVKRIVRYEKQFGCTINRKCDLQTLIRQGQVYPHITEELIKMVLDSEYRQTIIMQENEEWLLPAGAFGENCGAL